MKEKRPHRNISSLADRIAKLEIDVGEESCLFAYAIVDGIPQSRAFVAAYGYTSGSMLPRRMKLVAPLIALIKEDNNNIISEKLNMNKEQRLEHILGTALQAHRLYLGSQEAAHGAVYLKAMTIINTMTGDNAPTEVHHLVSVSKEQLDAMTHSQRTNAYKRMMGGNLELIDSPVQLNATDNNTTQPDSTTSPGSTGPARLIEHDGDGGQP